MKNILLIQTGGTIAMDASRDNSPSLNASKWSNIIDHAVAELSDIAVVEKVKLFLEDSSDINKKHWTALAQHIDQQYESYDGFVILHGTDTMAYTASALSFALQNIAKPVILTGSQVPMSNIRSDAHRNLINAIEIATLDLPEVAVCFNDHVYLGNRATKMSIGNFNAFSSPNYPPLAKVGLNIELSNHLRQPGHRLKLSASFANDLFLLKLYPNINPGMLRQISFNNLRALVIEAFGSGNFPVNGSQSLIPFFKRCLASDTLLIITSQAAYDSVDLSKYKAGRKAKRLGALSAKDMTTEATLTKLMYLLAKHHDNTDVAKYFNSNLAGELTN